ncbi:MAG: class I SAM-dependent methyltransferase [Chloroflexi bacterium]|nr:class I SAM-dependent methyltransferase [Chloroflexota bacterium]MBV9598746.1 class I SAM-dependent methyltransferase [Chloroflexota bacterium]
MYRSTLADATIRDGRIDPYSAHYQINRCPRCGLVFSSPIFDTEQVRELYVASTETNIAVGEDANGRRTMERYYALLRPALTRRERVLDIGCDVGHMLDIARLDGFSGLHGVEPVGAAARVAETIPGATITTDFYEDHAYPPDYFDLITLIHVVDHLVEPSMLLERAWKQLKPGGAIFAVVHNSDSLLARALGERFPPYNLFHNYFFSSSTLARLFQKCAFEIVDVVPTYNSYSLGFLVDKTPIPPIRRVVARVVTLAHLNALVLTIPLGNIGIVARRPLASSDDARSRR